MNSVIIYAHEVNDELIQLAGDRAREVLKKIGERDVVQIGIFEETRATAQIIKKSETALTLRIIERRSELARVPLSLIVGLSRPQTVKKVIQAAGLFGIESVIFLSSENGEKSYLQSHSLLPKEIHQELILAIEQSCDTRIPTVSVISSLKHVDTDFKTSQRFLFDIHGRSLKEIKLIPNSQCIVSIGPEAGWSDKEKDFFVKHDFVSHSFGERVLRVETAVVGFLGIFSQA